MEYDIRQFAADLDSFTTKLAIAAAVILAIMGLPFVILVASIVFH